MTDQTSPRPDGGTPLQDLRVTEEGAGEGAGAIVMMAAFEAACETESRSANPSIRTAMSPGAL